MMFDFSADVIKLYMVKVLREIGFAVETNNNYKARSDRLI